MLVVWIIGAPTYDTILPMTLKRFEMSDVALGWNNRDDLYELRPGESPDPLNVLPLAGGEAFTKRYGLKNLNNQLSLTLPIQTIYEWPAKNLLLGVQQNDVYSALRRLNSTWTKRYDSANTSSTFLRYSFELAKNAAGAERLWMMGFGDPKQWDGTSATFSTWTINPVAARGCQWIKLWKNRMVMGGDIGAPERIYYTNIGDPESPNPLNSIDIRSSYDDSDILTGAELIGDNLLVFKKNSTWLVYDVNTLANRRIGYPGMPNSNLSAVLNGVVYFMNHDSMWTCDGVNPPHPVERKVDTSFDFNTNLDHYPQLIADPQEERLLYLKAFTTRVPGDNAVTNSLEMYAYYPPRSKNNARKEGTWWRLLTTPNISALAFVEFEQVIDNWEAMMIGGGFTGGDLFQVFSDSDVADDAVNAISAHLVSGVIRVTDKLESLERIRRANLRITSDVPNVAGAVTVTITSPGSTSYSTVVNATDDAGYVRLRPEIRGREFQISFANAVVSSPPFQLRDVELMFRGGKEKR